MELWTAIVLGVVGSFHCAAMCGPLALALPTGGRLGTAFVLGRMAYNAGRLATYTILGALFGTLGLTFALAGLQRWISLAAGIAVLVGWMASWRFETSSPLVAALGWLKSRLGKLLRQRSLASQLLLGMLNGLLPCGLVYAACAGAVTTGTWLSGAEYMFLFGLGTVPMLLGIGLAGSKLRPVLRLRFQHLIPASLLILGLLLVVRGLSLGIPYLSPDLSGGRAHGPLCH